MESEEPLDDLENALDDLQDLQDEAERHFHKQSEDWWNSLSQEEQLAAFYCVNKRIHHGFAQGVSYRGILYGLFGFDKKSYGVGIASGFFEIYNHTDIKGSKDSNPNGE